MRIGFVGAGNMAAAMARGWSASEPRPELVFADAIPEKARRLAEETGGEAVDSVGALVAEVELVVLATKPAQLRAVAAEAGGGARAVLSILGGTSLAAVREAFPDTPAVRAIPNLPVAVRRGVICYAAAPSIDGPLLERVIGLLGALGEAIELPDERIDVATALMSTTPAYAALVIEALVDAGVEQGFPADLAQRLAVEAIAGTGELMRSADPVAIRRAVASPGGITAAGLAALERAGVRSALADAVRASVEKMRR